MRPELLEPKLNPANDTHFAISQQHEFKLCDLRATHQLLGELFECFNPDRGELDHEAVGSLFRILSYAVEDVLQGAEVVFPARRKTAPKKNDP